MQNPTIKIADPDDARYKELIKHVTGSKGVWGNGAVDGLNTFSHHMIGLDFVLKNNFSAIAFAEVVDGIAKSVNDGGKAVCKISDLIKANGNREWEKAISDMESRGMVVHNNQGDSLALTDKSIRFLLNTAKEMYKYRSVKKPEKQFSLDQINFIDREWPDKGSQYEEWGIKGKTFGEIVAASRAGERKR